MKILKVVFDTNILISAIVYGGKPDICLQMAREGKLQLITSNTILLELSEKLYSKIGMSDEGLNRVLIGIKRISDIVEPREILSVIKEDRSDNKILEAATEGNADYIISGDKKHILPLKRFRKTNIVTAADFIKLIDIEK